MVTAHAPGKIILLGEHAVVYGRPAIAVPVVQVKATATVETATPGSGCTLIAVDLDRTVRLSEASADDPLAAAARAVLAHLMLPEPDAVVHIRSTIPIASGLGSGAAVSTAIIRALALHAGRGLDADVASALVFQVEKLYHGTPSGVDNTVIARGQPVFFVRNKLIQPFEVRAALQFLIADTGIRSSTKDVVSAVRTQWEGQPDVYDSLFRRIGQVALMGRAAIESGERFALGALMDGNQWLLQQIGVSCPEIENIVHAARKAGALGAKLSGAGRGGNVIALVTPPMQEAIAEAMLQAGARQVIATTVS